MSARDAWDRDEFIDWMADIKRRHELGSDNQLAQHWGISHTMISAWKSGRQRPSMETLTDVAQIEQIDPRPLWVLAGHVNASDIGLQEDEAAAATRDAARPVEVDEVMAAYTDPRMTDDDRAYLRRGLHSMAVGMLTDLDGRDRPAEADPRRRAG